MWEGERGEKERKGKFNYYFLRIFPSDRAYKNIDRLFCSMVVSRDANPSFLIEPPCIFNRSILKPRFCAWQRQRKLFSNIDRIKLGRILMKISFKFIGPTPIGKNVEKGINIKWLLTLISRKRIL